MKKKKNVFELHIVFQDSEHSLIIFGTFIMPSFATFL